MEVTVLISSAGRRVGLVECFRESGRALGADVRVVAADMRPELSAACQLADCRASVPPCGSPDFIPALLKLCERERVGLLVPTIDPELPILSEHRQAFAAIGSDVAVSVPGVVALAADKERTATIFAEAGVRTPRTLPVRRYAVDPAALRWPVIFKPRGGSSSVGVVRPGTSEEAGVLCRQAGDSIVQELWEGREYTVNLFFDRSGLLRCAVPHWRIETRSGEVSKGRTEDVGILREAARNIARCLPGARGALCFQAIMTGRRDYAVFEINARFGGGYPLSHSAGAHFTRWLLEETLGLPCTAADDWRPGVTMLRYDAAVFRDE